MQTDYPGLELVVVDQGSTDGTREWLEAFVQEAAERGIPVRVVQNDRNVGACTGRNQGIAVASGRLLAFLDNDVVVEDPGWLRALAGRLDSEADAGLITAKLLYPVPPHLIQYAGCAVTPTGRIVHVGRARRAMTRASMRRELHTISACIVVKREVLDRVGTMRRSTPCSTRIWTSPTGRARPGIA